MVIAFLLTYLLIYRGDQQSAQTQLENQEQALHFVQDQAESQRGQLEALNELAVIQQGQLDAMDELAVIQQGQLDAMDELADSQLGQLVALEDQAQSQREQLNTMQDQVGIEREKLRALEDQAGSQDRQYQTMATQVAISERQLEILEGQITVTVLGAHISREVHTLKDSEGTPVWRAYRNIEPQIFIQVINQGQAAYSVSKVRVWNDQEQLIYEDVVKPEEPKEGRWFVVLDIEDRTLNIEIKEFEPTLLHKELATQICKIYPDPCPSENLAITGKVEVFVRGASEQLVSDSFFIKIEDRELTCVVENIDTFKAPEGGLRWCSE